MNLAGIFIIAVGLSMDAFAVAVCKGLSMRKADWKKALVVGLYFGIFQAAMPLIGYIAGVQFADRITAFDHWIAFILLGLIGGEMIKNSFCKDIPNSESSSGQESLSPKSMLPLAVATSIDALAMGITFGILDVQIIPAVTFIGVTTMILSMAGVKVGNVFGIKYKSGAELAGGTILIFMGVKILVEHLGVF